MVGDADGFGAESTSYVDADADASTTGWGSHVVLGRVLVCHVFERKRDILSTRLLAHGMYVGKLHGPDARNA